MRLIELQSDFLDESCSALSFKAQERLSVEPFYRLELVSPDPGLNFEDLLGTGLSVYIDMGTDKVRPFSTNVFAGYDTGQLGNQYTYTLELGSWLSFMAQTRNCRIFQGLSVPDIVAQVFEEHQFTNFYFALENSYEPREYCVQFQESDLDFVKRLLEDEGIYFWVEHALDYHVIMISDTRRFVDLDAPYGQMYFLPDGEESRAIQGREGIQRLQRTRRIRPNNVALRDFNYLAPGNRLDIDAQMPQASPPPIALEYYDYGAGYNELERGQRLARLRLAALQAESHLLVGQSNARALATGHAFTLYGHPDTQRNRRYNVVSTELSFVQGEPDSGAQGPNVAVTFEVLADDQPFVPLWVTPRPSVPGIQSATVVGRPGDEVYTDQFGRIRVHFHWDRYKTVEADASCWIRVSQAWAGKGWGVLALPRVGQEVLITYVDGDLDRPLVVGTVYNGENPTPYELPKDIRYTGLVSRSLRNGNCQNASQLTFDDLRGAERLLLHAERDMQQTVERNSSTAVGQDLNLSVQGTYTSVTGISYSYTGISVSYTGISASFTGVSTSFTGTSADFTGVSTSFTGVSTSFTGVNTGFTGVSTSGTGVSTSFTGVSTDLTGISTSVIGASTSVTGTVTSMTGVSSSITDTSTDMTGISISYTGTSTSVTGTSTSITGESKSVTGTSVSETGTSVSTTGSSVNVTGTDVSTVGSSTSTTTFASNFVGTQIAVTGINISSTAQDIKVGETKMSNIGSDLMSRGMLVVN
ncbi:type VI secretion system tip protein VgrG [Burkholderia sp. FERM BP-3421]|uniref:type VI secretion system Vgr family protein n=1 Tax=Burkholderia sp. FERM BP-3421 TaxID=1494466 RepID=UPI00235EFEDB|nr:type VI secretion system tip protein TssI/VgrG [Burkholderia sp. FERM BP-3421]WDD95394.1 type VI secretion system tip protein VgrG [Burkholderia sp. FERM BP-3421]